MSAIANLDTNNAIAGRLEDHAAQLARNKSLPWLGLGLHNDLLAAARALRGRPPEPAKTEGRWKPVMEFDL